jgi:GDP-4-dehydro-6-deoxy-D-mannose reductase
VNGPVLVTGAAGFAGSHLLQLLASRPDVTAWARATPPADLAHLARWEQVDILDRDRINGAIRALKPQSVFHCAGLAQVAESWGNTAAPLEVNVFGTHRLLDALRLTGMRCRVLVTGSAHVYAAAPDPIPEDHPFAPSSPYALSKLAQEQLALRAADEDGLDIIVTRSFNHTGPRQTTSFVAPAIARQIALIECGKAEPVVRVGNLDALRDLMDVRDTVRAYAALMSAGTPGTAYNVASGVGRPIRSVLEALLSRARVAIRVETDPARMRPSDVPVLVGDAARLRRDTGWQPSISFDRMVDDLLAYWRVRSA